MARHCERDLAVSSNRPPANDAKRSELRRQKATFMEHRQPSVFRESQLNTVFTGSLSREFAASELLRLSLPRSLPFRSVSALQTLRRKHP